MCNYPDVLNEDLPGLPPTRQVKFQKDLIQGEAPVEKSPYTLEPLEMLELSIQLQELLDKASSDQAFFLGECWYNL